MTTRSSYDVAIVGGGIAGCASAYYLAKRGLSVVLFEKGRIAGEQSGRNWGFVRQQGRDPLEIPMMMACIRIWRGLEAELEADIEWRQGGILYLTEDEAGVAKYEAWLDKARAFQLDSRLLSAREVAKLLKISESTVSRLVAAGDLRVRSAADPSQQQQPAPTQRPADSVAEQTSRSKEDQ
ncbi:MAG: FAD-dependent oxidoreductase [Proteobacteria bacterium]|nr:FAD-dependent oxidoreductase [Pseudomonadota bacterium]